MLKRNISTPRHRQTDTHKHTLKSQSWKIKSHSGHKLCNRHFQLACALVIMDSGIGVSGRGLGLLTYCASEPISSWLGLPARPVSKGSYNTISECWISEGHFMGREGVRTGDQVQWKALTNVWRDETEDEVLRQHQLSSLISSQTQLNFRSFLSVSRSKGEWVAAGGGDSPTRLAKALGIGRDSTIGRGFYQQREGFAAASPLPSSQGEVRG